LAIFNALWDVLGPRQRDVLAFNLSLLLLCTGDDENHTLRQYHLGALQLEFEVFPIQDPANVARFLAMLDGLGADAIAELIQVIHAIEVVMPQNHEQDLDNALVHNVSSSSGSDSTTTESDSSSNADE
jgi:hypothetical protein